MKCLSKVLGHRVLPEQLQCSLASILKVSELYWRDGTPFSQKLFPNLVFLMMVAEKAV